MFEIENENEFYRLVGMVAKIVVRVNQETKYCVFFRFSGHIDGFELSITPGKHDLHNRHYSKMSFAQTEKSDIEILREYFKELCGCLDGSVDAEKLMEAA